MVGAIFSTFMGINCNIMIMHLSLVILLAMHLVFVDSIGDKTLRFVTIVKFLWQIRVFQRKLILNFIRFIVTVLAIQFPRMQMIHIKISNGLEVWDH